MSKQREVNKDDFILGFPFLDDTDLFPGLDEAIAEIFQGLDELKLFE